MLARSCRAICQNRLNLKHVLFAFIMTGSCLILFESFNLNLNNHMTHIINKTADIDFYSTNYITSKRSESSLRCDPIDRNYGFYSALIDGVQYPQGLPLYKNNSINFECLRSSKAIKRILDWNPFFGIKYDKKFKEACPLTNCHYTSDRNLLSQSDLVLVHMMNPIDKLPRTRPPNQRWVFVIYETPMHKGRHYRKNTIEAFRYKDVFNLTSTYMAESDYPFYYEAWSSMRWKPNETFDETHNFYAGKTKFAAALISERGASSRLEYIEELKNYVPVDVFGNQGNKCPTKNWHKSHTDCKDFVGREYKFYLAFENRFCLEYITEKFFYFLRHPIIPVVRGGAFNYENFVPKSGFINANDFSSPKHLADYLIYLDGNQTAYNSYFKWKKHVMFDMDVQYFSPLCDMCIKLHLEDFFGFKHSVIHDVKEYWSGRKTCKNSKYDSSKGFSLENVS